MSLFGSDANSTSTAALQGFAIQTSVYGIGLQIALGTIRVVGSVIWVGAWTSSPVSGGGKLGGKGSAGGKGGGQYTYSCSFIIALCQGPVIAYGQVWQDRTQVLQPNESNPGYPNAFITGARGQGLWGYLASNFPNQALGYSEVALACYENCNLGTGGTISNYGFEIAGQSIWLTGIVDAAGGAPLSQVTITWVSGEKFDVAGYEVGQDIQVAGIGVTITAIADNEHMTVTPPPLGTGGGSGVVIGWQDALASDAINFLLTDFNCANFGYNPITGTPLVGSMAGPGFVATSSTSVTIGTGSTSFTTQSGLSYGVGMRARATVIGGGGWVEGAVTSYSGTTLVIDVDATMGTGSYSDWQLSSNNSGGVANYCLANGIGISPLINSQDTYSSYLTEWLLVCNSEAFSSEGVIKFATYGDVAVSGNGATFTPDLSPLYDLDNDDFIGQTVQYTVAAQQDRNNYMSVEWTNRGRQYNTETMNDEDAWAVGQYGLRIASPNTIHSVCLAYVAQQVLTVQLKRSVYMLRTAEFTLGWKYSALEPMDLVSLPEQYPSTARVLARLLTMTEDQDGNMNWTAEILPFPILNPTINPKQGTGGNVPGFNALPGATNPPSFFEVTPDLSNVNFAKHLILLIALSGGPNWGGCSVYLSKDGGNTYALANPSAPQQNAKSVMGFTTGVYPYGEDPDTVNLLGVNVQQSLGVIDSVAQSVADAFKSLVLVDDEIIAYEYATQVSSNVYNFESSGGAIYMRRGVFGTFDVPHATNAPFAVIGDGNQYEYELQPTDIGTTLWFKFPAFNQSGQQNEQLSAVTAYPFTVRGSQTRQPLPLQPETAFNLDTGVYGTAPGMRMQQVSVQNADPSVSVGVSVQIVPTANTASTLINRPTINFVSSTTPGGSIAAGTYLVALCGLDSNGQQTEFSLSSVLVPAGSSTISVTPGYGPSTAGYQMWIGESIDQMNLVAASASSTPTTITVSSIAPISSATTVAEAAPLDPVYDHTVLTAFAIAHGGVWGDVATSYGSYTITFTSASFSTNQFAGYTLKLYAQALGGALPFIPLLEAKVVSNTSDVLTLNIDLSGYVTDGILSSATPSGDVWVMRMMPQSITATGFTDPNLVNSYAPSGLVADQDAGNILIAIEGTGAGEIYNYIKSNTSDSFTIVGPWAVTPDSTTIFVIIQALPITPPLPTSSGPTTNLAPRVGTGSVHIGAGIVSYPIWSSAGTLPIPNQNGLSVLIVAQAADANGNLSVFGLSPMQEAYVFGQPGIGQLNPGYYVITPSGGHATIDLANGLNQDLVLNGSAVTILAPIFTGGSITAGLSFTLYLDQDSTGNRAAPTFTGGANGFVSNTGALIQISPTASTRTAIVFTYHGTYWSLDSVTTGIALS